MNKEIISKLELIKGTVRTALPQLSNKKTAKPIVDYLLTLIEELENQIKNEFIN